MGQLQTLVMTSLLFPFEKTAQTSHFFWCGWRRSAMVSEAYPQNFMARTLVHGFSPFGGIVYELLSHRAEQIFEVCWEAPVCGGKTSLEETQGMVRGKN